MFHTSATSDAKPCPRTKIGCDTATLLPYVPLWYITSLPVVSESLLQLYYKTVTLLFAWIIRTPSLKWMDGGWGAVAGVAWYSSSDTLDAPTQDGTVCLSCVGACWHVIMDVRLGSRKAENIEMLDNAKSLSFEPQIVLHLHSVWVCLSKDSLDNCFCFSGFN